jgi:hypothetical protein
MATPPVRGELSSGNRVLASKRRCPSGLAVIKAESPLNGTQAHFAGVLSFLQADFSDPIKTAGLAWESSSFPGHRVDIFSSARSSLRSSDRDAHIVRNHAASLLAQPAENHRINHSPQEPQQNLLEGA